MPIDFTGNDPNKFQDKRQYAPGDPRGALADLAATYQNVLAQASAPIPPAPVRPDGGFTDAGQAMEFRNAMRAHNQALKDASAYADTAKYLHDTLHHATIKADAGDFHNEFAHVGVDDPELAEKTTAILSKYPGAASDPSVLHSLSTKLDANARHTSLREAHEKNEEAYREKATKAMAAGQAEGTLFPTDFPEIDPTKPLPDIYRRDPHTGNITFNLDKISQLSSSRKAQGIGTKSDTAEVAAARHTAREMQAALADPELDPNDPNISTYKTALNEARLTIAKGTAPAKKGAVSAAAAAALPAAPTIKKPADYSTF